MYRRYGKRSTKNAVTKILCNERPKEVDTVKSKYGNMLTKENDIRTRWLEHFGEVLNRPDQIEPAEILTEGAVEIEIETGPPTKDEIRRALKEMKNGKAPGVDNITAEILKTDTETTVKELYALFNVVWFTGKAPKDWRRGLIIKLAKKGDLSNCGNWRGITLITTTAKIMGKIIIRRIVLGVDTKLREEQAGFRAGRGTTEQIFVLRNILEQAIEWNSNLYLCFIDFEKAFDSVHRETLWKIMKSYGIPEKLIQMVKIMYEDSVCAVIYGTGTTEWFGVKSGVKQGCNMSGFVFLLIIDWIMRKTTACNNTGIRWKMTTKLEDLDFADDIALLSSNKEQMQDKLNLLISYAAKTGLKINTGKTKVMRRNASNSEAITINGNDIKDVNDFIYLGATVSKTGGTNEDIRRRIGHARLAFHKLSKIWRSSQINRKTKIMLFKSNVIAVLLYSCETWKMTKGDEKLLDTFQHKCLRKILKIYWPRKVSNETMRETAGVEKTSTLIKKRRWQWLGHVLRMEANAHPRIALGWAPEGKRKRGRPKETWRRTIERERKDLGFGSWAEAARSAQDRNTWRGLVHGHILHSERRK